MEQNRDIAFSMISDEQRASAGLETNAGAGSIGKSNSGIAKEASTIRLPGQRGKQKRPTKILVTMRFSPEVLDFFKQGGEGWQTRMNEVLKDFVAQKLAD